MLPLITLDMLRKFRACAPALAAFEKKFGQSTTPKMLVEELQKMSPRCGWDVCLMRQGPELADTMLARGVNIHAMEDFALRTESLYGNTVLMKIYLEYGADVHARDNEAIQNAVALGRTRAVDLLETHGADVRVGNDSLVRIAEKNGRTEIVEILRRREKRTREVPREFFSEIVPPEEYLFA